ncbi:MAG: eCIS core domain-containing protein, partial [Blastocatellia bacterium]
VVPRSVPGSLINKPLDLSKITLHAGLPPSVQLLATIEPDAVTIGNDIYLKDASALTIGTLAHETDHVQHYSFMGLGGFLLVYTASYLANKAKGMNDTDAVANTPQEQAAIAKAHQVLGQTQGQKPCGLERGNAGYGR